VEGKGWECEKRKGLAIGDRPGGQKKSTKKRTSKFLVSVEPEERGGKIAHNLVADKGNAGTHNTQQLGGQNNRRGARGISN